MRKLILLTGLAAILSLTMCNSHKNSERSKARIKRMTNNVKNETTDYFYSSDGKIQYSLQANGDKTTYEYLGNKILIQVKDTTGKLFSSSTLFLNSAGLVDSGINEMAHHTEKHYYLYNNAGYAIQEKLYLDSKVLNNYQSIIKNGNVISRITNEDQDPIYHVKHAIDIEYYDDKPNTVDNENKGMFFYGTSSANLVKRMNFAAQITLDYNYQFDDQGRVILETVHSSPELGNQSLSFTYY
jgi:hypothetical protein